MLKFNVTNIFTSSAFWRILCETLFAIGKFLSFVLNDGDVFGDSDSDPA